MRKLLGFVVFVTALCVGFAQINETNSAQSGSEFDLTNELESFEGDIPTLASVAELGQNARNF